MNKNAKTINRLIARLDDLPANAPDADALTATLLQAGRALAMTANTPGELAALAHWTIFTSDLGLDQRLALGRVLATLTAQAVLAEAKQA